MTGKTGKNDGEKENDDDAVRKRKRHEEPFSNSPPNESAEISCQINERMPCKRARVEPAGCGGNDTQPIWRWSTSRGLLPRTGGFSASISSHNTRRAYVSNGIRREHGVVSSSNSETESEAAGHGEDCQGMDDDDDDERGGAAAGESSM